MVLLTENKYYTNIISPVMLLVAPISGLTVKISRFSLDPTIACIHQHLFKVYYFQFEHCYDTSQNILTPYSCICLFILFLQQKYTAVGSFSWHCLPSSSLLCINIIFSVYTNLNFNRMFFSTFQIFLQIFNIEYYNLAFLQQFFNTCYLF